MVLHLLQYMGHITAGFPKRTVVVGVGKGDELPLYLAELVKHETERRNSGKLSTSRFDENTETGANFSIGYRTRWELSF